MQNHERVNLVLPESEAEVEAEFDRISRDYRAPHCGCLASAKWYAAAIYRQMVEYRKERDQMFEYAARCRDDVDALKREIKDLEAELSRR